ncbi:MAG: MFS transporter [Chloroflexi bacterium]|nr:MFS transporter [Chloroflexota bacterium]
MIFFGAIAGLLLGLLLGGRLDSLINVRLRFALLILVAVVVRFGTQAALAQQVALVELLRAPLFALAFIVLAAALWLNRRHPGLSLVAIGVAANGIAIAVNAGFMPVYLPALAAAGLTPADLQPTFHVALPATVDLGFILRAGPLGDIVPIPFPLIANVMSLGDVMISIGLGWFILSTLLRGDPSPDPAGVSLWRGRPGDAPIPPTAFDRPMVLGGGMGPGLPMSLASDATTEQLPGRPAAPLGRRARDHPYVRLALDARFSAFWLGQTLSMFGDRLHQVALGVMVLTVTDSVLATALVFLTAMLPNLVVGPIAGTFVDRWDQKRVMVASDLIRAVLVFTIPAAASVDIALVYPLVFAITAVSLFFRPAKAAVVPRIVHRDDLLAANSATWTGETMADILGYPLAGLFVGVLGSQLELAFWVDGATYIVSALLIASIAIPAAVRIASEHSAGALRTFATEMRDGWRILRRQPVLFQNTVVSTFAQLSIGASIALMAVLARDALEEGPNGWELRFAALETAIGVGNLAGGVVVGLIGARFGKGRMVVAGFLLMGISTIVLGVTNQLVVALAAAAAIGIGNLVYVIPSQTLFAQHTPEGFMGRVVAFRSTLVFSAMMGAMAVAGVAAETFPVGGVIAVTGGITVASAVAAWFLPHVRDA